VPELRALFQPKPDDDQFYDGYDIDESRRPAVAQILGRDLDPNVEWVLQTYSVT